MSATDTQESTVAPSEARRPSVSELISNQWSEIKHKVLDKEFQNQIWWTLGSVVLALFMGTLLMVLAGYDAPRAWLALVYTAATDMPRVLADATPLIFTGLSVGLAFKCGLFNIGPEGQLYIGSMVATIVGYMVVLPILVHPLVCIVVAASCGFLWGLVPGLLKAYRGAHEVVTSMMLSYIAILLTGWLAAGPLRLPNQQVEQTPYVLPTAYIPSLAGAYLHFGLVLAVLSVFAVDYLISHTVIGYEMRAVGQNQDAAEYAGINSKRRMALAMGLAGLLAGLGGASEILGYHHRFVKNWSSGLGWDGITVAVLGNNNPYGILAAAVFFGILKTGARGMQQLSGVPLQLAVVIQGFVVVLVAAPRIMRWLSERTIAQGRLVVTDPYRHGPRLAALVLTLTGGVLGTGAVSSWVRIVPGVALLMLSASLLAFVSFALLLANWPRTVTMLLVTSLTWITGSIAMLAFGDSAGMVFWAALGSLVLVLSMQAHRMEEATIKGGTPQ
ncbi:MAG: ABC transporter permease [Candidatus Thorarchaeota archaeon]|nr:ABC transporter permease [Candidatus Thorarchaeota archaeon]